MESGKMRSKAVMVFLAIAVLVMGSCANGESKAERPTSEATEMSYLPTQIGDCVETEIVDKFFRLWAPDDPDMPQEEYGIGKEVVLKLPNNFFLYTDLIGDRALASPDYAAGNPVQLCLLSIPTDCPPGDDRGKEYSLLDRKTGYQAVHIDSWHLCGGA
jgi:hypothetical protein